MNRATACLIAFTCFLVGLVLTAIIASQVIKHDIPLMNIGLFMVCLMPVTMFAICIAILGKLWQG